MLCCNVHLYGIYGMGNCFGFVFFVVGKFKHFFNRRLEQEHMPMVIHLIKMHLNLKKINITWNLDWYCFLLILLKHKKVTSFFLKDNVGSLLASIYFITIYMVAVYISTQFNTISCFSVIIVFFKTFFFKKN